MPLCLSSLSKLSSISYRDKIHIVTDIILKLSEYGELNQTALMTFCGLNSKKHKAILDRMVENGLIIKDEVLSGKKNIVIFKLTSKGLDFCDHILMPYEKMFPRDNMNNIVDKKLKKEVRKIEKQK